jgi:PKD repeat protein
VKNKLIHRSMFFCIVLLVLLLLPPVSAATTGVVILDAKVALPPPVADFKANITTGTAPLTVQFTDKSTGYPTSWQWNFGDFSKSSTDQNPVHTYTKPGRYTVTLQVSNVRGQNSAIKPNYIVIPEPALNADFIGKPLTGTVPLTVKFTDTSTGDPNFWFWQFGESPFAFSFQKNPIYTYRSTGSYTVRLTAFRIGVSDIETKVRYVTVKRK